MTVQIVRERPRGDVPITRSFLQTLQTDRLQVVVDKALVAGRNRRLILHLIEHLGKVTLEGSLAGQAFIGKAAERKDIHTVVNRIAGKLFWAHVTGRARDPRR